MSSSPREKQADRRRGKIRRLNLITVGLVVLSVGIVAYVLFTGLSGTGGVSSDLSTSTTTLVTVDGSTIVVPDTSRQATVVFAMAYWCGTCIPEARALAQLGQEYGADLRIVALDIDPSSTAQLLQGFIDAVGENNLDWVFDTDGSVSRTYDIRTLDTTIILDSNGREVYRDGYPTPYDVLRDKLEEAINT